MEHEARAPVRAASRAGLSLSMIIPMQAQVTVVIHGWFSHVPTPTRRALNCAASASRKLLAALSVKGPLKAAAVGLLPAGVPHGPWISMTIPTTEEVTPITGIWIVHQFHLLFSVQQIAHVKKYSNRSQRMLLLVKIYKEKKTMKKKQTVICHLFKKLTFNCPVFFQQFHVNSQTLSYRIIKVAYYRILFFLYIERKPVKLRKITCNYTRCELTGLACMMCPRK